MWACRPLRWVIERWNPSHTHSQKPLFWVFYKRIQLLLQLLSCLCILKLIVWLFLLYFRWPCRKGQHHHRPGGDPGHLYGRLGWRRGNRSCSGALMSTKNLFQEHILTCKVILLCNCKKYDYKSILKCSGFELSQSIWHNVWLPKMCNFENFNWAKILFVAWISSLDNR